MRKQYQLLYLELSARGLTAASAQAETASRIRMHFMTANLKKWPLRPKHEAASFLPGADGRYCFLTSYIRCNILSKRVTLIHGLAETDVKQKCLLKLYIRRIFALLYRTLQFPLFLLTEVHPLQTSDCAGATRHREGSSVCIFQWWQRQTGVAQGGEGIKINK